VEADLERLDMHWLDDEDESQRQSKKEVYAAAARMQGCLSKSMTKMLMDCGPEPPRVKTRRKSMARQRRFGTEIKKNLPVPPPVKRASERSTVKDTITEEPFNSNGGVPGDSRIINEKNQCLSTHSTATDGRVGNSTNSNGGVLGNSPIINEANRRSSSHSTAAEGAPENSLNSNRGAPGNPLNGNRRVPGTRGGSQRLSTRSAAAEASREGIQRVSRHSAPRASMEGSRRPSTHGRVTTID